MAGCKTPNDGEDRGCGPAPKQTYFHVGMEGWTGSNPTYWDAIQRDFPATAPVKLGLIGYDGISGQHIMSEVLQRAEAEGLYLEFYRSYNVSLHHPGLYFDRITKVNTSDLKPCEQTMLFHPVTKICRCRYDFWYFLVCVAVHWSTFSGKKTGKIWNDVKWCYNFCCG